MHARTHGAAVYVRSVECHVIDKREKGRGLDRHGQFNNRLMQNVRAGRGCGAACSASLPACLPAMHASMQLSQLQQRAEAHAAGS